MQRSEGTEADDSGTGYMGLSGPVDGEVSAEPVALPPAPLSVYEAAMDQQSAVAPGAAGPPERPCSGAISNGGPALLPPILPTALDYL